MFTKSVVLTVTAASLLTIMAGCTPPSVEEKKPETSQQPKIEVPQGPVTFKVASSRTKDSFEEVTKSIRAKYPNVKLEFMTNYKLEEKTLREMIASGDVPDIFDVATTHIPIILDLDFPLDLEPIIQKYNVNLSHIDQEALKDIRAYNGKQMMIPTNLTPPMALFYNKDLFDRYGVPYPKVGSTWDELMDSAKKLSRSDGGINYMGLSTSNNANYMVKQMSLSYIDPQNGRSGLVSNEGWKRMFEKWKDIYSIPGNYPTGTRFTAGTNYFLKDKNLAMYPFYLFLLQEKAFQDAASSGFNWGVTTWPTFKDAPGVGFGSFSGGFMISKSNKYPEFAFQVMMTLMSDEGQIDLAKNGMTPSVTKPELRSHIYEGNPVVNQIPKDILTAIYNTKEPKPVFRTKYDTTALSIVTKYMHEYLDGKTDLNTVLLRADEEINKVIEADKK
ncbi:ABC transporter substrate-binding protein [Paenibacillus sp. UNC451MF]|uniref:ABC transporter substrate-binding protein n=1 Tax=Paenibacillus sp. UNC451MF TaxID=1449063 RepID=UPI00048E2B8D|nr:extracellular solute-binding protein [Paenibacillus sp. UNC451MF]